MSLSIMDSREGADSPCGANPSEPLSTKKVVDSGSKVAISGGSLGSIHRPHTDNYGLELCDPQAAWVIPRLAGARPDIRGDYPLEESHGYPHIAERRSGPHSSQ
jgi:hypothetical protein